MKQKYTFRGFLIALSMAFFDWHYFWIGNLKWRMWAVHLVNYTTDKVPILKAAKHCSKCWEFYYKGGDIPDMWYYK